MRHDATGSGSAGTTRDPVAGTTPALPASRPSRHAEWRSFWRIPLAPPALACSFGALVRFAFPAIATMALLVSAEGAAVTATRTVTSGKAITWR